MSERAEPYGLGSRTIKQSDRDKLLKTTETTTGEQLRIATEKSAKLGRELARAEREHAKLEEAVVKSLMGDSEYPPALLNKLIADRVKEIADLTAEREIIETEKAELLNRLASQKEFAENLDTLEARFDQADCTLKKAMLLNIIDRIVVDRHRLKVTYKFETRRFGNLQAIDMPDWLSLPIIDGTPGNRPPSPPDNDGAGGNGMSNGSKTTNPPSPLLVY